MATPGDIVTLVSTNGVDPVDTDDIGDTDNFNAIVW